MSRDSIAVCFSHFAAVSRVEFAKPLILTLLSASYGLNPAFPHRLLVTRISGQLMLALIAFALSIRAKRLRWQAPINCRTSGISGGLAQGLACKTLVFALAEVFLEIWVGE